MDFSVLGPLHVSRDGQYLDVGASKQRAVLAALLIGRNEMLSTDRLMESVWWNPPSAAGSNLRVYLTGLRRALQSSDESGARIRTLRAGGYLLRVFPGELDLDRFDGLVEQGEQVMLENRLQAADCFEAALRLWRGRALDGVSGGPALHVKVSFLEERRIAIAERWATLRLEQRRASDIVADLRALVGEYPLRERLWGCLMIALCRCGQPGEALMAYAKLRTLLVAELGADPGPELQQLYGQILRGDDWLVPGEAEGVAERTLIPSTVNREG